MVVLAETNEGSTTNEMCMADCLEALMEVADWLKVVVTRKFHMSWKMRLHNWLCWQSLSRSLELRIWSFSFSCYSRPWAGEIKLARTSLIICIGVPNFRSIIRRRGWEIESISNTTCRLMIGYQPEQWENDVDFVLSIVGSYSDWWTALLFMCTAFKCYSMIEPVKSVVS